MKTKRGAESVKWTRSKIQHGEEKIDGTESEHRPEKRQNHEKIECNIGFAFFFFSGET